MPSGSHVSAITSNAHATRPPVSLRDRRRDLLTTVDLIDQTVGIDRHTCTGAHDADDRTKPIGPFELEYGPAGIGCERCESRRRNRSSQCGKNHHQIGFVEIDGALGSSEPLGKPIVRPCGGPQHGGCRSDRFRPGSPGIPQRLIEDLNRPRIGIRIGRGEFGDLRLDPDGSFKVIDPETREPGQ